VGAGFRAVWVVVGGVGVWGGVLWVWGGVARFGAGVAGFGVGLRGFGVGLRGLGLGFGCGSLGAMLRKGRRFVWGAGADQRTRPSLSARAHSTRLSLHSASPALIQPAAKPTPPNPLTLNPNPQLQPPTLPSQT